MALLSKNLTLLTKSTQERLDLEREIVRRSSRLKEPRDYLKGGESETPLLPRRVLLFNRRNADTLTNQGRVFPPHHRFILIAALAGRGRVSAGPQTCLVREGEAMLIQPFQPHCFFDLMPPLHWVFVTFELPQDPRLEVLRERGVWSLRKGEMRCLAGLLRCWEAGGGRSGLPLHLALWLSQLLGRSARAPRRLGLRASRQRNQDLVTAVNRFALERLAEPLATREIACGLGFSPSTLRARFKEATGRALAGHLREIKLFHACKLLHSTLLQVGEIAAQCGYDSLFAFSRAFRNQYGCSPRDYRRRLSAGGR